MTITIKGTNLDLTPALKQYATEKVLNIEKFLPSIVLAELELERTTRHHQKGLVWRAEANLHAPQHLFRAEAFGEDIYKAIDALKKELKHAIGSLKEKRAGAIRKARRSKR